MFACFFVLIISREVFNLFRKKDVGEIYENIILNMTDKGEKAEAPKHEHACAKYFVIYRDAFTALDY